MTDLIKISSSTINNEVVQTINARDLHGFLESGHKFADWIQERIEQYDFIENQDYVVNRKAPKNPSGGRPLKDYYLTLDMAKELSMVERNVKGKLARRYFIECEKQLRHSIGDQIEWKLCRVLAAQAYHIQTKAVKDHLVNPGTPKDKIGFIYAQEGDVLNKACFGLSARQFKDRNPHLPKTQRDYAAEVQLRVLHDLSSRNAVYIEDGRPRAERLSLLTARASKLTIVFLDELAKKRISQQGDE